MALETDRLILRAWKRDDAEALYKLASDPDVALMCGWKPHRSVNESESIIYLTMSGPYDFAIVLKETGEVIGNISLRYSLPYNPKTSELGYWLGKDYWGHHYMDEAVDVVLKYAFLYLNKGTIWVGHYTGNTRSKAVILDAGFTYVRTALREYQPQLEEYRDCALYRMTKKHWLSLHPQYKVL